MGYLIKYECNCGFNKVLQLGSGMFSNQEDRIAACFTSSQMEPYWLAKKEGTLNSYTLENTPAFCENCNEFMQVPVLSVQISNQKDYTVPANCFTCNKPVHILNSSAICCPKCGSSIDGIVAGTWD